MIMSQHIRYSFYIATALISLMLLGCTPQPPAGNIVCGLGRQVMISAVPQRVVSLAPSNTEILFALGLADKVVGVTEYCNYPEAAKTKPKVGGFSTVDIEKVVSLRPDLVLATRIHDKTIIPSLENLGITVVALTPKSLNEVLESIKLAGKITGQDEEASGLVKELDKRITAIVDETQKLAPDQRPRVFYVTWHDPLMTAGTGTLSNDVISQAGGQNIASDITGAKTIALENALH